MLDIALTIIPRTKDLGGFDVKRILPYAKRRMVGPFIFLDHMGPAHFTAGEGINVRPHPHIGLATVTYLFEGKITHRDTLGSCQVITPGAVNWMTAGCGIAHSERTGSDERDHTHNVHGLQSWVALPLEHEECAPEFFHHEAASLPKIFLPGVTLRLIAGNAYGEKSPVKIYSPLFYIEARMDAGGSLTMPQEYSERAIYVISGEVMVGEETVAPLTMAVFAGGDIKLNARTAAHIMLLGGEPLSEPRHIYWNFVSSSEARIEQAKREWEQGKFGKIPGDDKEFIPLPETPKPGTIV